MFVHACEMKDEWSGTWCRDMLLLAPSGGGDMGGMPNPHVSDEPRISMLCACWGVDAILPSAQIGAESATDAANGSAMEIEGGSMSIRLSSAPPYVISLGGPAVDGTVGVNGSAPFPERGGSIRLLGVPLLWPEEGPRCSLGVLFDMSALLWRPCSCPLLSLSIAPPLEGHRPFDLAGGSGSFVAPPSLAGLNTAL